MSVLINFVGRLGADAETVTTGSTPFISCCVAVDETIKKDTPQTRWIHVTANADSFKNIAKYLTKGKLVSVRGVERVSAYTSKSGDVGVDTRVWADGIEFISTGTKSDGIEATPKADAKEYKNAQMTTGGVKKVIKKTVEEVPEELFDDDLPF